MAMIPVRRDAATAAFFDGTARGQFLLLRDTTTGELCDPHTEIAFDRERFVPEPASGRGHVVSWAAPHNRLPDGSTMRTIVGIVELEEGPWWWTELRGFGADDNPLGEAVVVAFEKSGEGDSDEVVPFFVKDAG
ncbi:hypothetical protein DEU37_0911 [Microbacterium sp. AG790]|uniref:Zn-ribbon domain-containing OB-fold protein n=1 Tax=Microbacterium sp. AG790 TaxID=2183995 RepID=UPI000EAED7B8|nr:hypothetical protein [Microbacterium sp. AG790]RKS93497.1 hypothetical protein DEU37_0911 [Microbacterium sp. AG790]